MRALLLAALLLAGVPEGLVAAAPAGGVASGLVRHATTGKPVPGTEVTLLLVGPDGAVQAGRTRSDARGRFEFRGLPEGRYLVQCVRDGVTYAAHALVGSGMPQETVIQVYDASDRVPLRLSLLGIAVEVRSGYVRVSEAAHIRNTGGATFLGRVILPLPAGARYVSFFDGLHAPGLEGGAIVDRLTVRPGTHQVAYGYSVAGSGEVDLGRRLPLSAERLELFVTAPAEARSPLLAQVPPLTTGGRTYTRAAARAVPAGDLLLTVEGVPVLRQWPAPAAAATLAGLLTLGLAWAVLRQGGR